MWLVQEYFNFLSKIDNEPIFCPESDIPSPDKTGVLQISYNLNHTKNQLVQVSFKCDINNGHPLNDLLHTKEQITKILDNKNIEMSKAKRERLKNEIQFCDETIKFKKCQLKNKFKNLNKKRHRIQNMKENPWIKSQLKYLL